MAQKVTSTDIKLALKEFHNGKPSYFITECKTCSTYFPDPQGLLKFDGLAITKSYTSIISMVYEVKPIFFRGRVREALWRKLRDQYLNVEAEIEIER